MKTLTAIPVYNEESHLAHVLDEVRPYCNDLLVVNDGSTDGTTELVDAAVGPGLSVITHPRNQGYGSALISAFEFFRSSEFDVLVTMDCDGQHEPNRIPVLLEALDSTTDIVSGSRYLREFRQLSLPTPQDRRQINQIVTSELNDAFGLGITDAFCGFKAYRREAVSRLHITALRGWGMPLQLWVQAAKLASRSAKSPCRGSTSIRIGLRRYAERCQRLPGILPPRHRRRRRRGSRRMSSEHLSRLKAPRDDGQFLLLPPLPMSRRSSDETLRFWALGRRYSATSPRIG